MPVTVVVGGQFGSEGKGKVAHAIALEQRASLAIRVGGPNSGHTVIDDRGVPIVFRQLPTAAIIPTVHCVLPAGMYVHVPTLQSEIRLAKLDQTRLSIDPFSLIVDEVDSQAEIASGLQKSIGSTGSGTGNGVIRRVARQTGNVFAKDVPALRPFMRDSVELLRDQLESRAQVILEGTQGFGLSLLHSASYPYCTSRDTTASGFLSEVGLSPFDVDGVVMVIRAYPIRVAGNSGHLPNETNWATISRESGSPGAIQEFTSVTNKLRRVAYFNEDVVKRALACNMPTRVVLNHVDYVDYSCKQSGSLSAKARSFVLNVQELIGRKIDDVGVSPSTLIRCDPKLRRVIGHG